MDGSLMVITIKWLHDAVSSKYYQPMCLARILQFIPEPVLAYFYLVAEDESVPQSFLRKCRTVTRIIYSLSLLCLSFLEKDDPSNFVTVQPKYALLLNYF